MAVMRDMSRALAAISSAGRVPWRERSKTVGTAKATPLFTDQSNLGLPGISKQKGLRREQKPTAGFADHLTEGLLLTAYAASEEAEPQTEEHGGQDRAEDGGLDDSNLALLQETHEENDLDYAAQSDRGIHQS